MGDRVKMIPLGLTFLLLHLGHATISVTTVQLGKPVTFECLIPGWGDSNIRVKWYKQSIGHSLLLIITLMTSTTVSTFEEEFPPSRFGANFNGSLSTLTIFETVKTDEAVYHCAVSSWNKDQWSGMYLSLKENSHTMTEYTVAQWPTVSDPVHPGDSGSSWPFSIMPLNDEIIVLVFCATSVLSVIVIASLICALKKKKCDYCDNNDDVSLQENIAKRNLKRNGDTWTYSAAIFTVMKAGKRDAKAGDRQRIYTAVKAFGLD